MTERKRRGKATPAKINLKRFLTLADDHDDYYTFRETFWSKQNLDGVDFHGGTRNDETFEAEILLNPPERSYYSKDTWHCSDRETAMTVIREIARFSESSSVQGITGLELSGSWVYVDALNLDKLRDDYDDKRIRVTG